MNQVVDTKVVEMQFDNSKFEKNIEVSLNSLKNLNKSIDDAGKNRNSLDSLAKAGDQVGVSFDNMNMKSRISLNMMDMLAGVGTKAFNRISDAVASFTLNLANSLSGMQAMRDGFAEYELKMGSVQTMLVGAKIIDPNTLKTTKDETRRLEIINDELQKLNEYSDKTIYSFKDMTSNIGKFTNNGVELHDAVDAIQGVANVAAAAGANSSEASRAMYNFSQALSSGAVKLIDWKSIENANMATQDFKQSLLDTALVLGTVTKEGKNYMTTTTDLQGKVSDLFSKTKGFNDSLSHQWMTTEVLTQTLKNYSTDVRDMTDNELEDYRKSLLKIGYTSKQVERIIENSRKAFEAATEVKTFTQMMDTLKESLGSGWAQTFEIVIGNFMEAKKLFTDLNNAIDNILSPIGKARNALLQTWKDNGGRQALINSFANLYHAIQNLFEPLKKLWRAFTPNTTTVGKGLAIISKWIEKVTGLIREKAATVGKILAKLLKPVIRFGNFISKQLMKLFSHFSSTFSKIVKFFSPVGKAFAKFATKLADIFGKHVISRIKTFRETFTKTFTDLKKRLKDNAAIKNLTKAFSDLKNILQELFGRALLRAGDFAERVASYVGRLWKAVKPLVSSAFTKVVKTLSDFLLPKLRRALEFVTDVLRNFAKFLGKIDLKNTRLYKSLSALPDKIKNLVNNKTFQSVTTAIKNFGNDALTFLSDKFQKLKGSLESIKMPRGLSDVFDNIKNFIKSIFGKDSVDEQVDSTAEALDGVVKDDSGKKLTAFQKFLEGISKAFDWLKNAAKTARDALSDFISFVVTNTPKAAKAFYNFLAGDDGILTLTDITDAISLVSTSFAELLGNWGLAKIGSAADNVTASIADLAEATVNLTKRVGNKFNMDAMKNFAIGVGILVASLWVLSKIPNDKLVIVTGVLLGLGAALSKFFGIISSGSAKLSETAGFIPISILLISMSVGMIAVAASLGILIGALAVFPKVIKQYNNLGESFRTGMDRVKEALEQIFEYLDHASTSKYSFRSAMALVGLVLALSKLRKIIIKFANKETGESMKEGLSRIKQVLETLGDFLSSVSLGSFSFINIGIDLDTVGMAAMILALSHMITAITPAIQELAKLTPGEFTTAFSALDLIFFEIGTFIAESSILSMFTKTNLGQWLGISATIAIFASTLSSCVSSLKTLAGLANGNPKGLLAALGVLTAIFIELGGVMAVIGKFKPAGAPLFSLSLAIGALTACVVALSPLANKNNPWKLIGPVAALSMLMLSLGGTLALIKETSLKTSIADVVKLVGVTLAMLVLTNAIRRLARTGGSAGSIVAAGAAIAAAALSIAGAMKIIASIPVINPLVLVGLGLLAAALWALSKVIEAFKGSANDMASASETVGDSVAKASEEAAEGVNSKLRMINISGILADIFKDIGPKISEYLGNINLGEALRNAITTVKEDMSNWGQDFIDMASNLLDGIGTALSNPANIEKLKSAMVTLGQGLLDAFKSFFGIASPSTVMAEQGGFIIDGLLQGLMEYPAKLAEWVAGIGNFIKNGISGIVEDAKEKGKAFVKNLGDGIQNGKEKVKKKAAAIGKAALDKVGKVKEWGTRAASSVRSYASKLATGAKSAKTAAGKIASNTSAAVKDVVKHLRQHASNAATQFAAKLRAGANNAKTAARSLVEGAKGAFAGIRASFTTYGQNAAEGFRAGIASLIESVANKAREMVNRAKAAAKAAQNSNSPSKDFMEFGGWAAEGYAIGLSSRKSMRAVEANTRRLVESAKTVASEGTLGVGSLNLDSNPALKALALAIGQISDSLDASVETTPVIRPVIDMSNVNRNAASISALFGENRITTGVEAAMSIRDNFEYRRSNNEAISESLHKLTNKIGSMTDTMNSRSLNNYITIDGSSDPNMFADELIRSFRLNARTV